MLILGSVDYDTSSSAMAERPRDACSVLDLRPAVL